MTYMPKKLERPRKQLLDPTMTNAQQIRAIVEARSKMFQKAASSAPLPEPPPMPEPPRSRIKMIAVTSLPETEEYAAGAVPYVLTHDDRIFCCPNQDDGWIELPPLPE
jgi:hypothetical protein